MKKQQFTITLDEWDSWLMALLCKRITWEGVADCAAGKDETENMIAVIERIRSQLAGQGIAPR